MKSLVRVVAALAGVLMASSALGQPSYPSRVVTLVAPFTAGSGSDIISRIIAPKLSARWGSPVIVDNKPGASGNIGADFVAKAAPDGYTVLMAINTLTMAPALYKNVPFDPAADFAPVTKLAVASYTFAVHPSMPAKNLAEVVEFAKRQPGKLNYGSPGSGTPHHLAMELLKLHTGVDIVHVPYKGFAGAATGLIAGQVQMMFATIHSVLPHASSGKLRLLAVTGPNRSALAPAIPTFREQGMGFMDEVDAWYAVFVPARTPPEIVAGLHEGFVSVVTSAEVQEQLRRQGLTVETSRPGELGELLRKDLQRWRKVINDARITLD